jgi:hypothetical protein
MRKPVQAILAAAAMLATTPVTARGAKRAETSPPRGKRRGAATTAAGRLAERTARAERMAHYRDQQQAQAKKRGRQVDGRGDLINPDRLEKKLLRREFGLTTGRAWRRFKKAAERHLRADQSAVHT